MRIFCVNFPFRCFFVLELAFCGAQYKSTADFRFASDWIEIASNGRELSGGVYFRLKFRAAELACRNFLSEAVTGYAENEKHRAQL